MAKEPRKVDSELDNEAETAESGGSNPPGDSGIHESSPQVPVSEKFQQQAHKLVSGANKHHLSHLRSKIFDREDELRDEETSKKMKGKTPVEFTNADEPY